MLEMGLMDVVEFYDVRKVESTSLVLNLENGKVEKPKFERSSNKGFRVLKNGFWGIFSGNVSDEEGIERAAKNATGKGDAGIVDAGEGGKFVMKVKKNPADISIEEKVELIKEIEKEVRADYIVSTKIIYIENLRKFSYVDSSGVEVYYEVPRTGIVIQAVAKDDVMQFYSKRLMKPAGYEIFDDRVFCIATEVRERLAELLKAKLPPSGEMNVVMDSDLGGVFIHEAFGHAVEADHVLQGATILAGRVGEKVACEDVNIYDDPTINEFGFYPFDDEGVRAERKVIVENGVLKSFLHSRETAAKLGGMPGNARAQGVAEPIVRMSNTFMADGELSFEELLEEAKNGIFLAGSRGGETNPATGYFQFNAQYGYLIRNGELAEPVRDVSLSGNTLSILRDIKLGKGLRFDPGFCGKAGQLVPVADGTPPSLVRAKVGGVA
ncbi:TldD/PmbA family protein [Archaeoglobus veneficus]|nr:TldD/PmbA family protein [Archaeoglobus veneficus]